VSPRLQSYNKHSLSNIDREHYPHVQVDVLPTSESPVAAKLRSYQGKPLPAQQQPDTSRSGISELARESEKLIMSLEASATAPLVGACSPAFSSFSHLTGMPHRPSPRHVFTSALSVAVNLAQTAYHRLAYQMMMSPPTSHLAHHMPRKCTQVDAVLHGETPVAARLRQRLPVHVLENSHMTSSNLAPSPQPHITPLRPGSREIGGGGDMSLNDLGSCSLFSHGETCSDEGCGSGNGFFEAIKGSFVEGSGKALIRNGRIQLLEVIAVRGYGPLCIPLPPHSSLLLSLSSVVLFALLLALARSRCLFLGLVVSLAATLSHAHVHFLFLFPFLFFFLFLLSSVTLSFPVFLSLSLCNFPVFLSLFCS